MYIHQQLRKLRKQWALTLQSLSTKVGYGTGNLSSYETGKLKPEDKTVLRILMRGYEFSLEKAKLILAQWRMEEMGTKYGLPAIAQDTEGYNARSTKQSIDEYLRSSGYTDSEIEKIKKEIKKIKKS